jgi:general secretion pathway protein E
MSVAASQTLVNLLLESGVPSAEEAAQLAVNPNSGSWVGYVLDSGKVDEQRFLAAIGNFFRVPVIAIDAKKIDRATLSVLPSRFVFQHHILPIEVKENSVVLATYDLFNSVGRQLATQLLKKKPAEWVLVPRAQLLRAMKTLYGIGAETFDEILKTNRSFEVFQEGETAIELNADDPEASVVKFVNQIIREAIMERATDIHVEPLENDLRIRYRIDGILHEVAVPPQLRVLQSAIISRLKVMAHMDIAERRLPQDGRMNLHANNQEIDVRVSTIPTVNGESISLRLLSRGEQQFNFERLDLSKKQEKIIRHLLAQPNGIILLTGPTGCGKSTSLYCFLSSINSVQRRIVTIEEPVEYRIPGVSQIDVKPEIDLTFAKGLRHILRQDPNVVMVGEIRDIETADIAIRAAMTGHLVFSTLHTNDAVGGITRLLDMDVEPFLLASVVKSFIAQRLVRTICPDCVEMVDYPREYLAEIGFPVKELGARFRRGAGCDQCRQTGYQGRAAIYEICLVTEPLRKLIMQRRDGSELKQCAIAEGMETLRQDGWRRVAQGRTTIEEVVRVTQTDEVMAETTEEV